MEERFRSSVLSHDSSFSKRSFSALFAQYTETLEALRSLYARASNRHPASIAQRQHSGSNSYHGAPEKMSSAERLHTVSKAGSSIDVDTSFAITPLGNGAVRAAYWVHADDFMNVQILLTHYSSQHQGHDDAGPRASPSSSRSSPRGSIADPESTNNNRRKNNGIGLIICDDLRKFSRRRSSETIEDIETSPGLATEKATASIRFSRLGDSSIAIDAIIDGNSSRRSQGREFRTAKTSKKDIRRLYDNSNPDGRTDMEDARNTTDAVRLLAAHPELRPLVKIQCERTRFLGLNNSPEGGLWATLDTDIYMRECSPEQIFADKSVLDVYEDTRKAFRNFPHAVLEVRIEGNGSGALIKALDESHLVSSPTR